MLLKKLEDTHNIQQSLRDERDDIEMKLDDCI